MKQFSPDIQKFLQDEFPDYANRDFEQMSLEELKQLRDKVSETRDLFFLEELFHIAFLRL